MAWLNNPPFSISEAAQRGYDVYEILYRDWGIGDDGGNSGIMPADRWPPSPGESIPISVAGIAIGPRSTVDRAWLTYNLLKVPPPPGLGSSSGTLANNPNFAIPANLHPFTSRIRQLSIETPLLFIQTAQTGANAIVELTQERIELGTMLINGSMYVWPQGANFDYAPFVTGSGGGEVYSPQRAKTTYGSYVDVNGVSHVIGPYAIGSEIDQDGWVGPLLHLYFFLKAPLVMPPTKRAPLKVNSIVNIGGGVVNVESLVAQIATFGRRTVHVMVKADQACNFRIGAIRTAAVNSAIEEPVDSALAVAANTPTILGRCTGCDFYADYLTIYATPTDGAHVQPNVTFNVTAQD